MTKEELLKQLAHLIDSYEYDEIKGLNKIVGAEIIFIEDKRYEVFSYDGESFVKRNIL